ncbi:AAA family ATPase [Variovorax sp. LARHSF232]
MDITFFVVDSWLKLPREGRLQAYLTHDDWDDWFSFQTKYSLHFFDDRGNRRSFGSLKMGQVGLQKASATANAATPVAPGHRVPQLPPLFNDLDPNNFFSLGQSEDFYSSLRTLPAALCERMLIALCDCAYDISIFDRYINEAVMTTSLLRDVRAENVRNRLNKLAHGNEELTRFQFQYTLPVAPIEPGQFFPPQPPTLTFHVEPNSFPPTNVHVLVGRNGAGKTRCIQSLVNAVLHKPNAKTAPGLLQKLGDNVDQWDFAGLVSVSFSVFDEFEPPPSAAALKIRAGFIGLRTMEERDGHVQETLMTKLGLANDFVKSFSKCREEPRLTRWTRAIRTLSADPLFAEVDVERFLQVSGDGWEDAVAHAYGKLSSGHSIVLLTITRLVELVEQNTLVVLDEPEGHLHPPLLSAFVRAVSDLLISRNGVALISTHSPVVLQEVPMSCVWVLQRTRTNATVERPTTETFGESAGVLTREVFGLEVSHSGFHQMVASAANQPGRTFEQVTQQFGHQLGSEARTLARSLVALRGN